MLLLCKSQVWAGGAYSYVTVDYFLIPCVLQVASCSIITSLLLAFRIQFFSPNTEYVFPFPNGSVCTRNIS